MAKNKNNWKRLISFAGFAVIAGVIGASAAEQAKYPATLSGGAPCGSCIAPAELSWKTVVPESPSEPGEPLEISGVIYQADGKTPAPDVVLFIYHTDATGYYNEKDDASHPRLRDWMKTGADGRYQFRTIKPAPYPKRTTPAHIHAHLYGADRSEYSIDDYSFAGDPLITETALDTVRKQGGMPAIIRLSKGSDGVWRGVRDISLRP